MKLTHLLEVKTPRVYEGAAWNWIFGNLIFTHVDQNYSGTPISLQQFKKFLKTSSDEFKALAFLNEDSDRYHFFLSEFKRELKCIHVNDNEVWVSLEFTSDIGMCQNYDFFGPPPFKYDSSSFEGTSFGVVGNASTLKTFPQWMHPNPYCLQFANTGITSFEGIEKVIKSCSSIYFGENPQLSSHLLGLLKIDDLNEILINGHINNSPLGRALKIIEKHLPSRDLLDCQEELIDAGLEEYAKL